MTVPSGSSCVDSAVQALQLSNSGRCLTPTPAVDAISRFGGDHTGNSEPGPIPAAKQRLSGSDAFLPRVDPGQSESSTGAASQRRSTQISEADIRTATLRLNAIQAFAALRASGVKRNLAARKVGEPFMTLYRWQKAYNADGFDGLLPQHKNSGRKPSHQFSAQQAADVKSLLLQTNFNSNSGSVPEAVRVAMERGLLDYKTVELIKSRFNAGQPPLPPSMREQVRVSQATTIAHRAPRNAWLKFVSSPGSLMLTRDEITGEEREIEPGEKWTLDDGNINFV